MNRTEAWKIVTEFVKAEGLRGCMSGQWVRTLARETPSCIGDYEQVVRKSLIRAYS
jgi:hypothetical protein